MMVKVIKHLTSPCFSLPKHLGFWQCICVNDEVNGLLTFLPASMLNSPVFVAYFSVLLVKICDNCILFWHLNSISTLILISYWDGFSSPSLYFPLLVYSWGLFKCWFSFSKCFQKRPNDPTFEGYFFSENVCLSSFCLDLSFPQNISHRYTVFPHSTVEKTPKSTLFLSLKVSFVFCMHT